LPFPDAPPCKILIVDDAIDNLRFLANILTQQGYQVRKVLNGHMALTAAKSSPPDLVLLDINMPQMNGYEVCQALKADPLTANIPVIFISALDDVLDRVRAYTVGGVDYIVKPFQFEEVVARVDTQLRIQALTQAAAWQAHRAERAETLSQQLFERVGAAVYQHHGDGRYHRVNGAFAQMLGYETAAALLAKVGSTPQALYVEPESWFRLMEQVHDSSLAEGVAQVYRADGSVVAITEQLYRMGESAEDSDHYLGFARVTSSD